MDHDEWVAQKIAELSEKERGELWRICEARRQRDGRGGADDVIHYETGVPDEIAATLESKGLVHHFLGLTGATHNVYYYYLRNGISVIVGHSAQTEALSKRVAAADSSIRIA
jgi:hypothetical protein